MFRRQLSARVQSAVDRLVARGDLPAAPFPPVEVEPPKQVEHGDLATNWAMVAFKALSIAPSSSDDRADEEGVGGGEPGEGATGARPSNPRALAELLASEVATDPFFAKAEVAGPGFLNLTLADSGLLEEVLFVRDYSSGSVLTNPSHFARPRAAPEGSEAGPALPSVNIEFVSVNPNGPITIGSGRGAAYGSTLANVLEAAGHPVHREYYINDGVNSEQMRLFAESVRALVFERQLPEGGYKGDYVKNVGKEIVRAQPKGSDSVRHLQEFCAHAILQTCYGRLSLSLSGQGYPTLSGGGWSDGTTLLADYLREESDEVRASAFFEGVVRAMEERGVPLGLVRWGIERKETNRGFTYYDMKIENIREVSILWYQRMSENIMLKAQNEDLASFGVTFDTWFSEQSLHDSGKVAHHLELLQGAKVADEQPYRTKVKFAKGGVMAEVEREPQAGLVDEEAASPPPTPSSSVAHEPSPPDEEGASRTLWLRSAYFGDDMDRVLRRKDGRLTYIASDVAYHADKFSRGSKPDAEGRVQLADRLITVLGPDHHGYIGRLHAVVAADLLSEARETPSLDLSDDRADGSGEGAGGGAWASEAERELYHGDLAFRDRCQAAKRLSDERLTVQIFQLVRFLKDGKPAPMRKRDGNIYALIDLINEIAVAIARGQGDTRTDEQLKADPKVVEKGKDVARFFYLMRHHDTTFDFDLDLAEKQSEENPVFYVQYAHARICGVLRKAEEAGLAPPPTPSSSAQSSDEEGAPGLHLKERALILKILDLPYEVWRCSEDYAVNRLTTYATELARAYHHFYDACRVIDPTDLTTTRRRLDVCRAAQAALKATFDLLGVSAPEKM